MKKISQFQGEKETEEGMVPRDGLPWRVPVLNRGVREGPLEKAAFEQRLEAREGVDHVSPGERLLSAGQTTGTEALGLWAVPGAELDT